MKITGSVSVFIAVTAAISLIVFVVVNDAIAVDGSPTGWWTDKDGNNHYGFPSSSRESGGSGNYSVPSGPSPQQGKAVELNDKGVEYSSQGDYDTAIWYFEEALRLLPDYPMARENLRKVRGWSNALKANEVGVEYAEKGEWDNAVRYYREALNFWPESEDIQDNLRQAEANAKEERQHKVSEEAERQRKTEEAERQRKVEEAERQRKLVEAKTKISGMLDDLAEEFGASSAPGTSTGPSAPLIDTSSSLEFIAPDEPLFSKGTKTSAPVVLDFVNPDEPRVLDPRVVKGEMSSEEAREERKHERTIGALTVLAAASLGQGRYEDAITNMKKAIELKPDDMNLQKALGYVYYMRDKRKGTAEASPKAKALLDAFEYGRGEWYLSMDYLRQSHMEKPNDLGVRDAYQFASGLSEGMEGDVEPAEFTVFTKSDPVPGQTARDLVAKGIEAMGQDHDKAFRYFKKAHEADPDHLGIRDMMNYSEGLAASQTKVAIEATVEKMLNDDERIRLENSLDDRPKEALGDLEFME